MNSLRWATSPAKGEHSPSRIRNFVFPSPIDAQDHSQLDGSRNGGLGSDTIESPSRLPVSMSSRERASGYPEAGEGVREARTQRLRRSTHNSDLRSYITSSGDASSTAASAGSASEARYSSRESIHLSNSGGSFTERILTWRHTATTIDQSLLHSPLSPRPFTDRESKRFFRTNSNGSLETAYKVDDTPREHNPNPNPNSPPSSIQGTDSSGLAALATMHGAQEQVRLGINFPTSSREEVQYRESDRVREGPPLRLDPSPKGKIKGDPVKKPTPLTLHQSTFQNPALKEDPQTYTTEGLTVVLSKLYEPGLLPSDVIAALPSPRDLSFLSDPSTPPGNAAQFRSHLGASRTSHLSQKDRNYIAYYIDTLLHRNRILGKEKERLEEDVEDAEVGKAGLQVDVNKYYAESQAKSGKVDRLGKFVKHMFSNMPEDKRMETVAVAGQLGLDLGEIFRGVGGDDDVDVEAVVRSMRKAEEDRRYWRARAEAAERYVGAME